ncbi:sugar phosphate isomerase/epimerase family protein [Halomicroarcula sp. GCM10025324]|uniref:sugar phosphate isomerase/epimerase family protein n=1 Tax=Haloarcula TaxID=2237 RepID=UPI0023E7C001|nr:TIM barrel protein [Halomicroarcula sp. ZS-22-S1]
MDLIGKCPPDADSLEAAAARGFDRVELYLTPADLDDIEATAVTVARSAVDAASVHTPHAVPEDGETFRRADDLACRLDAYLVVHSQYALHTHTQLLDSYGFEAPYGYENNPGASVFHLERQLFDRDYELVLDTAHLYAAEAAYLESLEHLLTTYGDRISVAHLTDGTRTTDGLTIGRGDIDLETTVDLLERQYDGLVVLEVMPDDQRAGRQTILDWLE